MKSKFGFALAAILLLGTLATGCASSGGSGGGNRTMDVHAVWSDMEANLEMPGMMALDAEMLTALYEGLPMDKVVEFEAHIAMMNVHAAEVAIFEATDANAAAEIKTALESRQDALEEQWSMYLPDQYELVKDAEVETEGKYAWLIVGEFADAANDMVERALGED